jgi:cell division protein ZapA (FtsZ GTPase activity inhibitor)
MEGGAMTEPTPREKHLRDLANTVYARLRDLERDGGNATEIRAGIRKAADFLRSGLDKKVEGE